MHDGETGMRVTSPAPRDAWLEVANADPQSFIYQTPAGFDAICATFNANDASRLYEFPDGRKLVLPLFRQRGLPNFLTADRSPLIGSLIAPGPVRKQELQAIFADLARNPVLRTVVRPTALGSAAWIDAAPKDWIKVKCRSHVLDLDGGFETVWKNRFNNQARRGVRKAEKSGLEIETDDSGKLVPVFYELLERSIERWAATRKEPLAFARWRARRRDPIEKIEGLAAALGSAFRIWLARVDGEPAAAIIVLSGANAHYTRGAMDISLAGPTRASFLLQKLAIEEACNSGCLYYNMGETGTSETLARFKQHFGAQAYSYVEYRHERFPLTRIEAWLRRLAEKIIMRGGK